MEPEPEDSPLAEAPSPVKQAQQPLNPATDGFAAATRMLWPSKRADPVDYRTLLPERFDVEVEACYEMDRAIGEGGYSKVIAARDRHCEGRVVAIKKVTKKSPRHVEAFYREAQVMRELDHPNICRLFELFEDRKHLFFVMELCRGGELLDRIFQHKVISEPLAANILDQIVHALRYAHERHIAHRDLKPENVCFCSRDPSDTSVKVIDWGLSALFDEGSMRSAVGTFLYAAPEVLLQKRLPKEERQPYDKACDMWSLGVLAYVMLCGRPPFWGDKKGMAENIRNGKYPMDFPPWVPSDGGKGVSAEAISFVRSLLNPDPFVRPTAQEISCSDWLQKSHTHPDPKTSTTVLQNLLRFSQLSLFRHLCVAIIAKQLDHDHLREVEQVFLELDTTGDGVLSLDEVKTGFKRILGEQCPESSKIEELFRAIDLDASGKIDYTEFCAAGMSERTSLQDEALWAAFRTLDHGGVSGRITSDDLTSVLAEADVQRHFSVQTCGEVAREVMRRFDTDDDGGIDFYEFRKLMLGQSSGSLPPDDPKDVEAVYEVHGVVPPHPKDRSRSRSRPGCPIARASLAFNGDGRGRSRSRSRPRLIQKEETPGNTTLPSCSSMD